MGFGEVVQYIVIVIVVVCYEQWIIFFLCYQYLFDGDCFVWFLGQWLFFQIGIVEVLFVVFQVQVDDVFMGNVVVIFGVCCKYGYYIFQ